MKGPDAEPMAFEECAFEILEAGRGRTAYLWIGC
jgi:hypothetical protein